MKILNPNKKCLGCHCNLESKYYFCSITCACLCGYMHVRTDGQKKDINELKNSEVRDKFLNNPPRRVRDKKYL